VEKFRNIFHGTAQLKVLRMMQSLWVDVLSGSLA